MKRYQKEICRGNEMRLLQIFNHMNHVTGGVVINHMIWSYKSPGISIGSTSSFLILWNSSYDPFRVYSTFS